MLAMRYVFVHDIVTAGGRLVSFSSFRYIVQYIFLSKCFCTPKGLLMPPTVNTRSTVDRTRKTHIWSVFMPHFRVHSPTFGPLRAFRSWCGAATRPPAGGF